MTVHTIISGGQTGADQAGLRAARDLGLATGGWMPKGWLTQAGPRPDFEKLYGMREHSSPKYPPRTAANVKEADATLVIGRLGEPGCRLTRELCLKINKPFLLVPWIRTLPLDVAVHDRFRGWLSENEVKILNVAGNREESNVGVGDACYSLLVGVLS